MMLWLLANHNYSQAKKGNFSKKEFTAKVNTTRRDKAITEKKGFTNLVRRDLKMCFVWLESVAVFCYCLLGGSIFLMYSNYVRGTVPLSSKSLRDPPYFRSVGGAGTNTNILDIVWNKDPCVKTQDLFTIKFIDIFLSTY